MTDPENDHRTARQRARDEEIAAKPRLAPPNLPPDATQAPMESHLLDCGRARCGNLNSNVVTGDKAIRSVFRGLLAVPLTFSLLAALGLLAAGAWGGDKRSADLSFAAIDKRVRDWQPTAEERRMDEIGWAGNLREALGLAKDNSRPVFLFTYSGEATEPNAIALRRC